MVMKMKLLPLAVMQVVAGGAFLAFAATPALSLAQQANDSAQPQELQKVYVTGSNIKTLDTETASPIQTITQKDIQRLGVTNVADLITSLGASTNSGLSDISGASSFAPGGTSVSLRNLGEQSTLVLLNGRRLPSYALANFTDVFTNVDAIPINAVERVDVLKTGASAIYGSDAVAGVINIITRDDFQGVIVTADHEQSVTSGKFPVSTASITAGFGDYNTDGYNVMLNADFYKRDSVMWTNLLGYVNPQVSRSSPSFGSYSTYSYPGNIIDGPTTTGPVPGCAPSLIINGLCKYDRYDRFQAVPDSDRDNFYASGTLKLGGGVQAFGEAFYSKIKTQYADADMYYGDSLAPIGWGNPNTGQRLVFNYLGLPASSPINPTGDDGVGFRYRFTDDPAYTDVDSSEYRVLGGLRGTYKGFDWETAAGVMGSKTTDNERDWWSASGFNQEIGNFNNYTADLNPNVNLNYQSTDPNFFNQPGGYRPGQANSAAVLNTLFPVYGYSGKDSQSFIDGKISGSILDLPAGSLSFAAGGEVRHESYSITPTANLADGDIVGNGISASNASRTTESVYTEFNIPILKGLEANAAIRADKYPDLATHLSPKLSLLYKPTDYLLFRGTLEHGFRAPNLVESATSLKYAFDSGTQDPLRCPAAQNLANALNAQAGALPPGNPQIPLLYARAESVVSNECAFSLADEVKNNPGLLPESSRSASLGMVLEPVKGYSVSLDYWNITRKNTIGTVSDAEVLDGGPIPPGTTVNRATLNPAADPTFTAAEITQYGVTAGPLENIVRELENIYEQRTSGIDMELKGITRSDYLGKVTTALDATYLLGYYDSSISDIHDNLAGQYGYPRINGSFTLSLDKGNFSHSLRFNYTSGYSLQLGNTDTAWNLPSCEANGFTESQCHVKGTQTVNYYFAYTGIKNLTLTMNVINLFNQDAPADLRAFGVDGVIPPTASVQDAQGRLVKIGLQYKFK
jgi:iron complex outermembrane receptor protein